MIFGDRVRVVWSSIVCRSRWSRSVQADPYRRIDKMMTRARFYSGPFDLLVTAVGTGSQIVTNFPRESGSSNCMASTLIRAKSYLPFAAYLSAVYSIPVLSRIADLQGLTNIVMTGKVVDSGALRPKTSEAFRGHPGKYGRFSRSGPEDLKISSARNHRASLPFPRNGVAADRQS